jgi:hypothetical protein
MFSQLDKQIIRSWRQYLIAPRLAKLMGNGSRRSGPRIAVVGNCQSFGVAYSMKILDPSATVDHFSVIARGTADISVFAKTLQTYDYVFSHLFPKGHVRGGDIEDLRARVKNIRLFPAIVFAGFHPDLIYLHDAAKNDAPILGPLGLLHSALAVFAFREGLSLEEANALYNRNVYEALGYFDVWNSATSELLDMARDWFNLDLSGELMNWSRRGAFMYSVAHPKPFVLFDLAKRLFADIGRKIPEVDFDYYSIDDLARSEIFPIYPPIGELLGVRGGYLFKQKNFHLSQSVGDVLTLPEFLAESYKVYARHDPAAITQIRVDAWRRDRSVADSIIGLARENLKAGRLPVR